MGVRTGEESSLRVTTWDEYQHYTDRRPPWIKFHIALLDNYELMQLRAATKWLACGLLLVAATNDNVIPNDSKWIGQRVSLNTNQVAFGLGELFAIGFLEFSSGTETREEPWASRHVSAALRSEIMARDSFACVSCKATEKLEIDHIQPISKGGTGDPDNLQVLCRSCNRAKRARTDAPQLRSKPLHSGGALARSQETETETETEVLLAKTPKKERARDLIFEALLEACGVDYATLTESGRGPINRGVRELKAVDANPEEIHRRASVYRRRYPEITLTPSALVKHWGALNDSNGGKPSAEQRMAVLAERQRKAQEAQ